MDKRTCAICGGEIRYGEQWTEVGGKKYHWWCWVRGPPAPPAPPAPKRYVIPASLQEEFVRLNRRADAMGFGTEWGGYLLLRDDRVVLERVKFGEPGAGSVRMTVPRNDRINLLGTVHYHPFGSGPTPPDLTSWAYVAKERASSRLRPLFIITYNEGFRWYLFPTRHEVEREYEAVVEKFWGTDALERVVSEYYPEPEWEESLAKHYALYFLTANRLMGKILSGTERYGKDVVIELP